MRQIIVRAWDKTEKKMWTDVLPEMGENENYDNELSMWSVGNMMEEGYNNKFEFMLYIDIKDKNGKKIFRGDLLLIPDEETIPVLDNGQGPTEEFNHIAPVIFENGSYGIDIKENAHCYSKGFYSFEEVNNLTGLEDIEIIGNIYENPELS